MRFWVNSVYMYIISGEHLSKVLSGICYYSKSPPGAFALVGIIAHIYVKRRSRIFKSGANRCMQNASFSIMISITTIKINYYQLLASSDQQMCLVILSVQRGLHSCSHGRFHHPFSSTMVSTLRAMPWWMNGISSDFQTHLMSKWLLLTVGGTYMYHALILTSKYTTSTR